MWRVEGVAINSPADVTRFSVGDWKLSIPTGIAATSKKRMKFFCCAGSRVRLFAKAIRHQKSDDA
jgi:hypothetical protein